MADDFLLSVLNTAVEAPYLTIYVGVEATLEVKLTNNTGGTVSFTTGNTIKFTPPDFIDMSSLSSLVDLSESWELVPIDPMRDWFKISAKENGNWQKDTDITFTLPGVQNKSSANAGVNGPILCYSDDVFDSDEYSSQQLSLNNAPSNVQPNLKDVLNVTLNNGGIIFVGDSLANQLTLNLKNIREDEEPLFDGSAWPEDDEGKIANPRIKVFFDYGTAGGALTTEVIAASIGVVQLDTEYGWECSDLINSSSGPLWLLNPQVSQDPKNTEIIGTGNYLNASFLFSDIIALNTGATQMYVQCIGFPSDDNTFYNDHTFIVPIDKKDTQIKPITYFSAVDLNMISQPGETLSADLTWQVFNVYKIRLTALHYLSLVNKEFTFTDVLSSGYFSVDLSEFYDAKEITFNLEAFDQSGENVAVEQRKVAIVFPPIEVEMFKVVYAGDKMNPKIEVIISPIQLIQESSVKLTMVGIKSVYLEPTVNDPSKFIYEGKYKDFFKDELIKGKDYQFQLDLDLTIGTFKTKLFNYVPIEIGDLYAGGIVFWLFPADNSYGLHGLVCAISDQHISGTPWLNGIFGKPVVTGAIETAIGTGKSNTDIIIAVHGTVETNYVAGLARAYTSGGFTDWFLPSIDELYAMFINKDKINATADANGGTLFVSNIDYWSSTEIGLDYVWSQSFYNGDQYTCWKGFIYGPVRAVRTY